MDPARIQQLLELARTRRLLVLGDVMLDEFVWGRVSRISPEAPVPVVEVHRETCYPGGAANVARNLRPFCEGVEICGLTGEDAAGDRLRGLLGEEGISMGALVSDRDIPTILKTRIVARHQQVVRVDREKRGPLASALRRRIVDLVAERLPALDGIILEDYGKGLLDQEMVATLCDLARKAQKVITADPSIQSPLIWTGVTALKPNRAEAFALAGRPDPGSGPAPLEDTPLLETASLLRETHGVPLLLVTLGEQGMLLVEAEHPPVHIPTRAREVFDVSGAGDTAIALFTLALCAGASPREAAELSNYASGVVIGKLGTATLTPGELLEATGAIP